MFNIETELHLRQLERDQQADGKVDTVLRWALVLSNLTVLTLLVAHLI